MHTAGRANPEQPAESSRTTKPVESTPGPELADVADAVDKLADEDLVARLDDRARRERLTTLEILVHLAEIDSRRLWRTLEYRSMFDYCVRRLRYSEGAASRRIRTARLFARYPRVAHRIRDRRLSLCVASRIARAVLEDGRADLIEQVEGKRLDQVDAMLATHRNPSRPVRESIRLLCVERPIEAAKAKAPDLTRADPSDGPIAESAADAVVAARPDSVTPSSGDIRAADEGKKLTRIDRVFRFQFGVNADAMAKFSRVQAIAATRAGKHVDLTDLFTALCDAYLDRYDPHRRAEEREEKRRKTRRVSQTGSVPTTTSRVPQTKSTTALARHIPQALRDQVFLRDEGRCTFVDSGGERCTATTNLHVDHIRPFALGGKHEVSNLRLLCSAHNQLMAERTFGRRTVEEMAGRE